jgi:hypothetical protein
MKRKSGCGLSLLILLQLICPAVYGWDEEGHRMVNELALASLPTNFPAFVRTGPASERIGFLAGEPDRWRNVRDLPLSHCSGPDHYIDLEQLADYGLKPDMLPVLRGEFIGELAVFRKAHPEKFVEFNTPANADHTRELVGLLPWAITENYGKLKSCFAYLKTFEENGGTPEEIANAHANVIYVMGVMGHYVGDASQPLHTTIHHHGWVGENPHQFTTDRRFHSRIDGFLRASGGADLKALEAKLRPAQLVAINGRAAKPEEMFQAVMLFVLEQNKLVVPLYQLEKDGKLPGNGEKGAEGKVFLEGQLVKSGQLLGDIWYSAWQQAPPDTYLQGVLARRRPAEKADAK